MNVYEIDIWRGVYHNGEWSHNSTRLVRVHALNKDRALLKITLDKAHKIGESNDNHIYTVSDETVYSITKRGTVVIKPFYVYSDGYPPQPVKK